MMDLGRKSSGRKRNFKPLVFLHFHSDKVGLGSFGMKAVLYGVARRAGLNDTESQDVVQESLVSVAKHIPTFQYDPSIGSFKAWLLTMTRWRIIAQFRKRGQFVDQNPHATDSNATALIEKIPDAAAKSLDAYWEAAWETNLLDAAVAKVKKRLPERYQIFEFYVNKEWPPRESGGTIPDFGEPSLFDQAPHY